MELIEKTLDSKLIFEGRVIKVKHDRIELQNGAEASRELVEHPGGVSVIALDDKNRVVVVKQFRYPFGRPLIEIPAGKLEKGEDPFEAMKREQKEETGTTSEKYIDLGKMYSTPGFCNEVLYMWACRISSVGKCDPDEDEFLEVSYVPIEELYEKIMSGEIKDAKTQIGILKVRELLSKGLI